MILPTYQTALEQLAAEDFSAALLSLDQVIEEHPEFAAAYYQRGRAQVKLGNLASAIADYSQAIRLQPTAEAFLNRALTYLLNGNPQGAIADAQQATDLDHHLAPAPHLLGKVYAQIGDSAAAIVAYKQAVQRYLVLQDKPNAQVCIDQIEALRTQSPHSGQARSLDPAVGQNFLQQAKVKLDRGDQRAALLDLEWLLQLEPDHPQALCLFANLHAQLGNGQLAIDAISRALQANPDHPELRFQRGKVRLALQDTAGAIAEFTQLLAQDNRNVQLYQQRGQAYVQLGDGDRAFKDFSNAIGLAPEEAQGYYLRASVQHTAQDFEAALTDYQQAASLWFNQGDWPRQQTALAKVAEVKSALQKAQQRQSTANLIRVPIKFLYGGIPVVEVVFNDHYPFDMLLDPRVSITIISPRMAMVAGVQSTGRCWGQLADGRQVELAAGAARSIRVGTARLEDVQVAIAPEEIEGFLGQNFLTHYEVRILTDAVELRPK
jgi:tetratricopeptide (TPR) repeat protein